MHEMHKETCPHLRTAPALDQGQPAAQKWWKHQRCPKLPEQGLQVLNGNMAWLWKPEAESQTFSRRANDDQLHVIPSTMGYHGIWGCFQSVSLKFEQIKMPPGARDPRVSWPQGWWLSTWWLCRRMEMGPKTSERNALSKYSKHVEIYVHIY